jgi:hypothetical protein
MLPHRTLFLLTRTARSAAKFEQTLSFVVCLDAAQGHLDLLGEVAIVLL